MDAMLRGLERQWNQGEISSLIYWAAIQRAGEDIILAGNISRQKDNLLDFRTDPSAIRRSGFFYTMRAHKKILRRRKGENVKLGGWLWMWNGSTHISVPYKRKHEVNFTEVFAN